MGASTFRAVRGSLCAWQHPRLQIGSAAVSNHDEAPVSPFDSWRYILRFVSWLAGIFFVVTTSLYVHNALMESGADEAETLLAGEATDEAIKQAYELVSTPHVFAGWHVPAQIFPEAVPALSSLDEEALADVLRPLDAYPEPGGEDLSLSSCEKSPTIASTSSISDIIAAVASS